jgi:hypothetical protein
MKAPVAALLALAVSPLLHAQAAPHNPISADAIASHVRFLADDLLEGREAGSRGHAIAARYVAAQFTAAGLTPAGDGGSFLKPIALRAARLVPAASSFVVRDGAQSTVFEHRKDILISPDRLRPETDVDGEVVFAGYGVVAPELQYDDYAGIDVHGKLVMLMSGAPASFPNNPRAYYSSGAVKAREAADRGAVGIVWVRSPADEKRTPFARALTQREDVPMGYVDASGNLANALPAMRGNVRVDETVANALFAHAPSPLAATLAAVEKGEHRAFPLGVHVAMKTATAFSDVVSENVIGTLRGSDPKLRAEYVVYSAHLDHLGVDPNAKGDPIYNGALDNASGIACLLEIAKAFAATPKKPARSILFVALTAEEKGEQGSEAFVDRPPVPRASLVADINMDMFMMLYPVKDVVLLGGEHTTLGAAAARAAKRAGFTVSPDPQPEEVRFVRSDQYSFVKKGIPAMHLKAGLQSTDPTIDAATIAKTWLREIYHRVGDESSQHLDWASGAKYAYANLLLGLDVANAPQRPQWKAGDFFAAKFAHASR